MQVIIDLETKNKDGSDHYYLKSIIDHFYVERGTGISIKYEYMNGKGNYEKVNNKVKKLIKEYAAESHVIYCIDIDKPEIKIDQNKLNLDIKLFCEKNQYELVYFNKTIEHVLLSEIITKDKTSKAQDFFRNSKINNVDIKRLTGTENDIAKWKMSNVLNVLNKYLIKKDRE